MAAKKHKRLKERIINSNLLFKMRRTTPLPNPLPARASWGEGAAAHWREQWTPSPHAQRGRGSGRGGTLDRLMLNALWTNHLLLLAPQRDEFSVRFPFGTNSFCACLWPIQVRRLRS